MRNLYIMIAEFFPAACYRIAGQGSVCSGDYREDDMHVFAVIRRLLFFAVFLFIIFSSGGCGPGQPLEALTVIAMQPQQEDLTPDPNNFDSDGRRIAGGCNHTADYQCYEYSSTAGYYHSEAQYLIDNCGQQNGNWIRLGCPQTSPIGYCARRYTGDQYVRRYFYANHPWGLSGAIEYCMQNNGTWTYI